MYIQSAIHNINHKHKYNVFQSAIHNINHNNKTKQDKGRTVKQFLLQYNILNLIEFNDDIAHKHLK